MNNGKNVQSVTERVTYGLRDLYERYGYSQFRMNKFEEYDLYSKRYQVCFSVFLKAAII